MTIYVRLILTGHIEKNLYNNNYYELWSGFTVKLKKYIASMLICSISLSACNNNVGNLGGNTPVKSQEMATYASNLVLDGESVQQNIMAYSNIGDEHAQVVFIPKSATVLVIDVKTGLRTRHDTNFNIEQSSSELANYINSHDFTKISNMQGVAYTPDNMQAVLFDEVGSKLFWLTYKDNKTCDEYVLDLESITTPSIYQSFTVKGTPLNEKHAIFEASDIASEWMVKLIYDVSSVDADGENQQSAIEEYYKASILEYGFKGNSVQSSVNKDVNTPLSIKANSSSKYNYTGMATDAERKIINEAYSGANINDKTRQEETWWSQAFPPSVIFIGVLSLLSAVAGFSVKAYKERNGRAYFKDLADKMKKDTLDFHEVKYTNENLAKTNMLSEYAALQNEYATKENITTYMEALYEYANSNHPLNNEQSRVGDSRPIIKIETTDNKATDGRRYGFKLNDDQKDYLPLLQNRIDLTEIYKGALPALYAKFDSDGFLVKENGEKYLFDKQSKTIAAEVQNLINKHVKQQYENCKLFNRTEYSKDMANVLIQEKYNMSSKELQEYIEKKKLFTINALPSSTFGAYQLIITIDSPGKLTFWNNILNGAKFLENGIGKITVLNEQTVVDLVSHFSSGFYNMAQKDLDNLNKYTEDSKKANKVGWYSILTGVAGNSLLLGTREIVRNNVGCGDYLCASGRLMFEGENQSTDTNMVFLSDLVYRGVDFSYQNQQNRLNIAQSFSQTCDSISKQLPGNPHEFYVIDPEGNKFMIEDINNNICPIPKNLRTGDFVTHD